MSVAQQGGKPKRMSRWGAMPKGLKQLAGKWTCNEEVTTYKKIIQCEVARQTFRGMIQNTTTQCKPWNTSTDGHLVQLTIECQTLCLEAPSCG
eukprot:1161646-Pelagomonas_calceolata.AAC.25